MVIFWIRIGIGMNYLHLVNSREDKYVFEVLICKREYLFVFCETAQMMLLPLFDAQISQQDAFQGRFPRIEIQFEQEFLRRNQGRFFRQGLKNRTILIPQKGEWDC